MLVWLVPLVVFVVLLMYCGFPVLWTRVLHQSSYRSLCAPDRVALTFDDGPHPVYTPKLLDVLAHLEVKATFFVVAERAMRHPDIIERMKAEGHEVQVHANRHLFVPFLDPWSTAEQCLGARAALRRRFSVRADVYRPTWGACNLATLFYLRKSGIKMCLWTIMVGDWHRTDPSELTRRVVSRIHDGAVIVLHDADSFGAEEGAPQHVIEAMPTMVSKIREKGYTFSLVSEWL